MKTYIPLTEEMLILNNFKHREDGTYSLLLSDASFGSQKQKFVIIEKWDKDYPENKPFYVFITNDLIELKLHVGTVKQLKNALRVCDLSYIANTFNTIETSKITDERFWEIVKAVEWKNYCDSKYNIEICKKNLEYTLTKDETVDEFRCKLFEMYDRLNNAIYGDEPKDSYCKIWEYTQQQFANQKGWYYLGDDSWHDLRMHIIGLGKTDFDKVVKNPKNLKNYINYKESFSYITIEDNDCFYECSDIFNNEESPLEVKNN